MAAHPLLHYIALQYITLSYRIISYHIIPCIDYKHRNEQQGKKNVTASGPSYFGASCRFSWIGSWGFCLAQEAFGFSSGCHWAVGQKLVPKMACSGKRKHGLKPAVSWWFNFDPQPLEFVGGCVIFALGMGPDFWLFLLASL